MEQIIYKNKIITYQVIRKDIKNVNIRVTPKKEVFVSANHDVTEEKIKEIIKSKLNWIVKQIEYYENTDSLEIDNVFISGETIKYLGKQYKLKVISNSDIEGVEIKKPYMYLYLKKNCSTNKKNKIINDWYLQRAKQVFTKRLKQMIVYVNDFVAELPEIVIRKMRSRWGSCYQEKNQIVLNFELIKTFESEIDYVILHELLHFKYKNHNKEFYTTLTALMPDWKNRKKLLDEQFIREL